MGDDWRRIEKSAMGMPWAAVGAIDISAAGACELKLLLAPGPPI